MDKLNEETFFEKVYNVVRQIPRGRATSYGMIAKCIGAPKAARMVGWAMNNAHNIIPPVPAHRVVNRKGLLTGQAHFSPPTRMAELLEEEGIKVVENQIINFDKICWDPMQEF